MSGVSTRARRAGGPAEGAGPRIGGGVASGASAGAAPRTERAAQAARPDEDVLRIEGLSVVLHRGGERVRVVDAADVRVAPGEIVGVVGESGAGKSMLAQSVLRLADHAGGISYEGRIEVAGVDVLALSLREMTQVRGGKAAMIFQDPLSSLNPSFSVGSQLMEALRAHGRMTRREARAQACALLETVGIDDAPARMKMMPRALSGGMRQRVMIAMALACRPRLLVADEPTTALDAITQRRILELIASLAERERMGVLFVSHDLSTVASLCDRILVMYAGRVVETLPAKRASLRPAHPYTRGLMAAVPPLEGRVPQTLPAIAGSMPAAGTHFPGCRFCDRCEAALKRCACEEPPVVRLGEGREVRCWLHVPEEAGRAPRAAHDGRESQGAGCAGAAGGCGEAPAEASAPDAGPLRADAEERGRA